MLAVTVPHLAQVILRITRARWGAALWGSILYMIIYFSRLHRLAGALQWPYLVWVSFASLLNAGIYF